MRRARRCAVIVALAVVGCKGEKGDPGATGATGPAGSVGPPASAAPAARQIVRRRIPLHYNGAETCAAFGERWAGLVSGTTLDDKDNYLGTASPSCASRVVDAKGCSKGRDYAIQHAHSSDDPRATKTKKSNYTADTSHCLAAPYADAAVCLVTKGFQVDTTPPPSSTITVDW